MLHSFPNRLAGFRAVRRTEPGIVRVQYIDIRLALPPSSVYRSCVDSPLVISAEGFRRWYLRPLPKFQRQMHADMIVQISAARQSTSGEICQYGRLSDETIENHQRLSET